MTDQYIQELRPTGKANEFQIFYIKTPLSKVVLDEMAEIALLKEEKTSEDLVL